MLDRSRQKASASSGTRCHDSNTAIDRGDWPRTASFIAKNEKLQLGTSQRHDRRKMCMNCMLPSRNPRRRGVSPHCGESGDMTQSFLPLPWTLPKAQIDFQLKMRIHARKVSIGSVRTKKTRHTRRLLLTAFLLQKSPRGLCVSTLRNSKMLQVSPVRWHSKSPSGKSSNRARAWETVSPQSHDSLSRTHLRHLRSIRRPLFKASVTAEESGSESVSPAAVVVHGDTGAKPEKVKTVRLVLLRRVGRRHCLVLFSKRVEVESEMAQPRLRTTMAPAAVRRGQEASPGDARHSSSVRRHRRPSTFPVVLRPRPKRRPALHRCRHPNAHQPAASAAHGVQRRALPVPAAQQAPCGARRPRVEPTVVRSPPKTLVAVGPGAAPARRRPAAAASARHRATPARTASQKRESAGRARGAHQESAPAGPAANRIGEAKRLWGWRFPPGYVSPRACSARRGVGVHSGPPNTLCTWMPVGQRCPRTHREIAPLDQHVVELRQRLFVDHPAFRGEEARAAPRRHL